MALLKTFEFTRIDSMISLRVGYEKGPVQTACSIEVREDKYLFYPSCPEGEDPRVFYKEDEPIIRSFKTEVEARVFSLGYALVNDVVLVGHDTETTSLRDVVTALANGLQEGCNEIGPGGPHFTPVTFPD